MSADDPRYPLYSWTSNVTTAQLRPGHLFAYRALPFRVTEVRERAITEWSAYFLDAWDAAGRPDPATWRSRPLDVVYRYDPDPDGKPLHGVAGADREWIRLPEHYLVCGRCGQIPPCQEIRIGNEVAAATARMEFELALTGSTCHGCAQPVTTRQRAIRFDGPNLVRPDLGEGSAVFHLRRVHGCFAAAHRYDAAWAAAVPGRARRLECTGRIVRHHDRTAECDAPTCPGPEAFHPDTVLHHPRELPWRPTLTCRCLGNAAPPPAPVPETPGQLGLIPDAETAPTHTTTNPDTTKEQPS